MPACDGSERDVSLLPVPLPRGTYAVNALREYFSSSSSNTALEIRVDESVVERQEEVIRRRHHCIKLHGLANVYQLPHLGHLAEKGTSSVIR